MEVKSLDYVRITGAEFGGGAIMYGKSLLRADEFSQAPQPAPF